MTNEKLDTNYSATQQEKEYVKNTINTKGVKELFNLETTNLKSKIIRNFHTANYVELSKKTFAPEKKQMKDIINADPEIKAKYEAAVAHKGKWRSEGIMLLQAIAIKCVNIINQSESVESKLTSRNGTSFKSASIDGIVGPNTFYVLASIAKEKGISFNGVVDKPLLAAMISICGSETPAIAQVVETTEVEKTEEKIEEKTGETQPKTEDKKQEVPTKQETVDTPKENTTTIETQQPEDEVFTAIQENDEDNTTKKEIRNELTESEKTIVKEMFRKIMEQGDIPEIIGGKSQKVLEGCRIILVKKLLLLKKEPEKNKELIIFLQGVSRSIVQIQSQAIENEKKKLNEYQNFDDMNKKITTTYNMIKIKFWTECSFLEETTTSKVNKKITYKGKTILEIWIGIENNELQFFSTFEVDKIPKTQRAKTEFDTSKIIQLISEKIQEEKDTKIS